MPATTGEDPIARGVTVGPVLAQTTALGWCSRATARGEAISGGVALAGTCSAGEAAIAYLTQGRSIGEAKKLLGRLRRRPREGR